MPERLALILTQLLQANGRVVSKESLAVSVWPDEAVSDANLTQHIYMLRQLLGDKAKDHSHILAVPRQGYRFLVPVQATRVVPDEPFAADPAALEEIASGTDFEAFRHYCQGSFFLAKRTAADLRKALDFFQKALVASPLYVPALIGLARAYGLLGSYWHLPPDAAFPFATAAIEKALMVEPGNAVAHAVYASSFCYADWNWERAREETEIAIALNPGSPLIRNNAAWIDVCTGRYEEALAQARLALALEPSSLLNQLLVARVLLHWGKYDHATAIMTNIIAADDSFHIARRYRAQALLLGGDPQKALDDLERLPGERGEDPGFRLPMLGRAYADLGEKSRAASVLEKLRELSRVEYVALWNLAIVAIGIGLADDALAYLETAYERREATLPFLKSLHWFEPIAKDRRFAALLAKVGP
ncbi:MAG: winged helix-turn-helix domain-containing protein [Candidatus Eremiobacteraeota bacterium]|nr:winged helix-turn-helix domain-containing protein [Candidatus Eremiobacteraeota bacterium]